jgi:hypothetical protein
MNQCANDPIEHSLRFFLMTVRFPLATGVAASLAVLALAHPSAQQYPADRTSPVVAYKPAVGRCLPADQRKVNDDYNSLSRPTRPGDDMPFWDPEYFVGTWDVEMRSQDSAFSSGGAGGGTLTIKANAANGCLDEGTLTAEDPDGKKFTRSMSAVYDPAAKTLTWTEKDSRGYTITEKGPIGGELGGLFHFHFGDDNSVPATMLAGKQYRFKGVVEMSSPDFFKNDLQISEGGGPFKTFGRVTYDKEEGK